MRPGYLADVTRTVYHQPGLPVDHRLTGPTGTPGHLGDARGRRFEEDDAEPLLLEPEPPVAAGHHEDIRRTDQPGQVVIGDGAEQARRGAGLGDAGREPFRIAAATGNGHRETRKRGLQAYGCVHDHVHALAGHEATDAHHQGAGRRGARGPIGPRHARRA